LAQGTDLNHFSRDSTCNFQSPDPLRRARPPLRWCYASGWCAFRRTARTGPEATTASKSHVLKPIEAEAHCARRPRDGFESGGVAALAEASLRVTIAMKLLPRHWPDGCVKEVGAAIALRLGCGGEPAQNPCSWAPWRPTLNPLLKESFDRLIESDKQMSLRACVPAAAIPVSRTRKLYRSATPSAFSFRLA
jgi:hypothetical protein